MLQKTSVHIIELCIISLFLCYILNYNNDYSNEDFFIYLRNHSVLGIEVSILHLSTPLILTITLGGRYYKYVNLTDDKVKANTEKLSNFPSLVKQ